MKIRAYVAFVAALIAFVTILICVLFPLAVIRSLQKNAAQGVTNIIMVWGDRLFTIVCAIMRIKAEFHFDENLTTIPQCIVIANHQSTMDALVVPSLLKRAGLFQTRFIGKREAAHFPFVGYLLKKSDVIFVGRRGDPRDRQHVREGAEKAVRDGASIFLFPEGTRFAGKGPIAGSGLQRVLPPKPGGFYSLRQSMHDAPVLSTTIRWHPSVGENNNARTIFQAAAYYKKAVRITTRLVPADEVNADPQWLEHEWERKDAALAANF